MKRFVARRVASFVLVGTMVTGGLFVTSTPANAGIRENCKAAFKTILRFFRAVDTAAHHEQRPDNRISWNDMVATANGRAEIAHLPAVHRNINTYLALRTAGGVVIHGGEFAHEITHVVQQRLDVAGRHDRPDGLVSDIDLRAAIANPGAICG